MEPEYRIPPRILMSSMGLVLGVYLGALLAQILWTAVLALLFFPETAGAWTAKRLEPEDFVVQADLLMPPALFWMATALTVLTCFALGVLLAGRARFSPLGHTAFAAILLSVSYLQFAFDKPAELKWMALVAMVAFPAALVAGSHWMLGRMELPAEDEETREGP